MNHGVAASIWRILAKLFGDWHLKMDLDFEDFECYPNHFLVFLSIFLGVVWAYFWNIIAFLLYQAIVGKEPRDGIYHQILLILRNFPRLLGLPGSSRSSLSSGGLLKHALPLGQPKLEGLLGHTYRLATFWWGGGGGMNTLRTRGSRRFLLRRWHMLNSCLRVGIGFWGKGLHKLSWTELRVRK